MRKPSGYWNKETCYHEAKKYTSRNEFLDNNGSAYNVARKNKWLDDYTWFEKKQKPNGYWNSYEHCYDEAKKFNSRSEFLDNSQMAYNSARKNGWLDDYTWFERPVAYNKKWNRETCYEEAKKYNSKAEFRKNASGAYNVARRNGWLGDYNWFEKPIHWNKKWDRETCYIEAAKYKSKGELCENASGAYNVARRNGWLRDYTWFENRKEIGVDKRRKWNCETCRKEAIKYKSRGEFAKGSKTAYQVARKNGWLGDYTWFNKK